MKIETKMLKTFISVLCAATMVASGAVVSVGAAENDGANKKSDDTVSVSSNYTNTTNTTAETSGQRKKTGKKNTKEKLARKQKECIKHIKGKNTIKNLRKEPKNQLSRKNDIKKSKSKGISHLTKKTKKDEVKKKMSNPRKKEMKKVDANFDAGYEKYINDDLLVINGKKIIKGKVKLPIVSEKKLNKNKRMQKSNPVIRKKKDGLKLGNNLAKIKTGSLNKNKNKKQVYIKKSVSNKNKSQWSEELANLEANKRMQKELANLVSNQLYYKKLNGISRLTKNAQKEEKKLISNQKKLKVPKKLTNLVSNKLYGISRLTKNAQKEEKKLTKLEANKKKYAFRTKKKSKEVDSEDTEKLLSANISKLEYGKVTYLSELDLDNLLKEEYPKPAIKPDGLDDRRDGGHKKVENSKNDEKLKNFAAQMPNNYPNQYGKIEDELVEPVPQNCNEIPNQYRKIEDELEEPVPQNYDEILKGLKSKYLFKGKENMNTVEGSTEQFKEFEEGKSIVGSKVIRGVLRFVEFKQPEGKNNNDEILNRGTDYSIDN